MGKIKDLLFPALAGLDDIEKARLPAVMKLNLLRNWRSAYQTQARLKCLRAQIAASEREVEAQS